MRTCSHEDRPVPVVTACPLEKLRLPAGWQQSSGSTAPGDWCYPSWHAWVGFHWATYRLAGTDMCFEFSIVTQWNHMDRHSFLCWHSGSTMSFSKKAHWPFAALGALKGSGKSSGWLCLAAIQDSISQLTKVKSMWFNSCAKMDEDGGLLYSQKLQHFALGLCKILRLSLFFALKWQNQCRHGEGRDTSICSHHLKTDGALV